MSSLNSILRTQNLARQPAWHRKQEKFAPWSKDDWIIAFGGELGEMLNEVKKLNRLKEYIVGDEVSWEQKVIDLSFEIADCILYLDLLSDAFGFDENEFPQIGAKRCQRNREVSNASALGRDLLRYTGRVADICSYPMPPEGMLDLAKNNIVQIYWGLYEIGDLFDIDVKSAIQRKFNITSAQHTLGVELHFED